MKIEPEYDKVYIFMIHTVYTIGGTQMYVHGKARYLHNLGWKVYAFLYDGSVKKEESVFHGFDEYMEIVEGCNFLSVPPYRFRRGEQDILLDTLVRKIPNHQVRFGTHGDKEIIIETFFSNAPYWGELLAERMGARHFFFSVTESHRSWGTTYEDNLDFFYFKWKRNEFISSPQSLRSMFNGYKNVRNHLVEIPHTVREQDAVQDVNFPEVEKIPYADWTICHIGRIEKGYVAYVISGVAEFAKHYSNKKVNFVFVGDAELRMDMINETFKNLPNVNLIFFGDLVPIPRILFSKVDVVCAVSQTARFSADEGTLTIVGHVNSYDKTPGVLGYDTTEPMRGDNKFTYFEALENVLVKRLYDDKKSILPKLEPAEKYYEKFWTILKNADPKKEYYTERLSKDRIRQWVAVFPFAAIARGTRIILFGATEIAKDYMRQIEAQHFNMSIDFGLHHAKDNSQQGAAIEVGPYGIKKFDETPYCYVVSVVDRHPENFDDSVKGPERLKELDYDAIVITEYSTNVPEVKKIIMKMAPQMADRVVCNLRFFDVYLNYHRPVKFFDL